MYETQLKELLNLAAIASTTIASCDKYMRELQSMKQRIQRTAGVGLVGIQQVNQIDKLVSKLVRRKKELEGKREFQRRDEIRDVQEKKDDVYKVKPLVQEVTARKSYRK